MLATRHSPRDDDAGDSEEIPRPKIDEKEQRDTESSGVSTVAFNILLFGK